MLKFVILNIGGILACLLATGCGPGVEGRYPVRGTITYNGEPIAAGSIVFVPLDSEGKVAIKAGGSIANGAYELPAQFGPHPGPHNVEIVWMKPTGRKLNFDGSSALVDELIDVMPAKFNKETVLMAEIISSANVFNFELTGSPLAPAGTR